MIFGIILFICLILGLFLTYYGGDKNNTFIVSLGVSLMFIGLIGIAFFVIINYQTISSWFKI